MRTFYNVIYMIVFPFFNFVHPGRAVGRENIPKGGVLVCGNHTAMSDPLFLAFAFRHQNQLRPMAKAELLRVPFIGWILRHVGVFGVERGKSDVGAIKQAMKYLKEGEKSSSIRRATGSMRAGGSRERQKMELPCWLSGAVSPSFPSMCRNKSPGFDGPLW